MPNIPLNPKINSLVQMWVNQEQLKVNQALIHSNPSNRSQLLHKIQEMKQPEANFIRSRREEEGRKPERALTFPKAEKS